MTFENIIDIFSEHLKNDENIEIVKVKKGYLHLYWDKVTNDYNHTLITSFDELYESLLSDVESYYKYESKMKFSNEEERDKFIKNLQDIYYNKYKNLINN